MKPRALGQSSERGSKPCGGPRGGPGAQGLGHSGFPTTLGQGSGLCVSGEHCDWASV